MRLAVDVVDRVFAEVPDVSAVVLGVPVPGHLDRFAVIGDDVLTTRAVIPSAISFVAFGGLDHVVVHRPVG